MQDIAGWKFNLANYHAELDSVSRVSLAASLTPHAGVRKPILKSHETSALRLQGQILSQRRLINSMMIEVHKEYSIPAACIVFVLIGAPLGILARRGGVAISLGALGIQIYLGRKAPPFILMYMTLLYWVAAPILYVQAKRLVATARGEAH